jgi:hypothetical protein
VRATSGRNTPRVATEPSPQEIPDCRTVDSTDKRRLIDLWKDLYVPSFDLISPKLAPGGFVVADNMLHPERASAVIRRLSAA